MIVVDHVTKYYGSHAAVRDLDFRIEEGECVGFLGLNGAGKTTTLRLLACLLLPTSGRVRVKGLDAEEQPHEIRKLLGFLPDTPPVYPEMKVRDFLRFAGRLRDMTKAEVEKRMPEVLETTGLTDVADDTIGALSHGYRQRVGIAQAIIHAPALLILDEPIQGLDPVQIVEMRQMIRDLRGKHTILLSTHILGEIKETCDRILMLHQGHITAQGTESELAERFGYGVTNIELVVRGGAEALREAIEAIEGAQVLGIVPAHATYRDAPEGALRAEVRATRDVREEVAKAVVSAGLGLLSMTRLSTGLENIFVKLSRDTAGKEAAQ